MDPNAPQQPSSGQNLEAPVAAPQPQWSGAPPNLSENTEPNSNLTPRIRLYNGLILIFLILVLIEWFFPTGTPSCNTRGCASALTLPSILIMPTFLFGFIAGGAFFLKSVEASKSVGVAGRVVGGVVGLAAAAFFVVVGAISAIAGSFRGQPPSS